MANHCDRLLDFFSSKINKARSCTSITSVSADLALNTIQFSGAPFSNFSTRDLISLGKEASQMKAATSIVDSVPTGLFEACFACVDTVVLTIVNGSAVVPASSKITLVTPVPKKTNNDLDNFNNLKSSLFGQNSQLHTHLTLNISLSLFNLDSVSFIAQKQH